MGKFDEARVRKTSEIISRQVGHMRHLVDDLLDVSRVTGGVVKLETAPLDLRDIVADAVEQSGPLIWGKAHTLSIDLQPHGTTVLGDAKRLVQIVGNLLNNAAKYTPDGGAIDLRIETGDEHVKRRVAQAKAKVSISSNIEHCFQRTLLFKDGGKVASDRSRISRSLGAYLSQLVIAEPHSYLTGLHELLKGSTGLQRANRFLSEFNERKFDSLSNLTEDLWRLVKRCCDNSLQTGVSCKYLQKRALA
ncbi:ATP-binding protein [Massilia sp. CCM 8734]|uniref:ATP-binding protein n=1 Tax=Massilia sp. CCM 8734 TaxID=2609283 RepID=UPI0034D25FCA